MPCDWCAEEETVYCPDCEESFCRACSIRLHHPGTKNELHSLEQIAHVDNRGVKILTPILDELLAICVFAFAFSSDLITPDYLHTSDVCPLVGRARKGIASLDSGVFFLMKGVLNTYCNIEDSYWRLFTDLWVRSIVTTSDSLFLLLSTTIYAWLFSTSIVMFLVPFASTVYGIPCALWAWIEHHLPRWRPLVIVEAVVRRIDLVPLSDPTDVPPKTEPRKRKSQDYVEFAQYWKARIFRQFSFYRRTIAASLRRLITYPMYAVVVVRLVCIFLGGGPTISLMLSRVGLEDAIHNHGQLFGAVSKDEVSDRLLMNGLRQIPVMLLSVDLGSLSSALRSSFGVAVPVLGPSAVIAAPFLVVVAALHLTRKRQQNKFMEDWDATGRTEALGPGMREIDADDGE